MNAAMLVRVIVLCACVALLSGCDTGLVPIEPTSQAVVAAPTPVPVTLEPSTPVPVTVVPATALPTPVPSTAVPPTPVPLTQVPPTPVPPTSVPPTPDA